MNHALYTVDLCISVPILTQRWFCFPPHVDVMSCGSHTICGYITFTFAYCEFKTLPTMFKVMGTARVY